MSKPVSRHGGKTQNPYHDVEYLDSKPAAAECYLSWLFFAQQGRRTDIRRWKMYLSKVVDSQGSCLRFCLTGLIASLFLTAVVHATEIESLTDKLPRAFIGEFTWDGDKTVQNVVITFEAVRALSGQDAEAVGCGAYEVNRKVTMIKVRMLVTSDLQVEILEQSPEGSTPFETEGSHRGNLSKDLQRIDAQWTTRATGQRGQLHLRAAMSAVCAPAASL
jgi:hypothetical protein